MASVDEVLGARARQRLHDARGRDLDEALGEIVVALALGARLQQAFGDELVDQRLALDRVDVEILLQRARRCTRARSGGRPTTRESTRPLASRSRRASMPK